MSVTAALKLRGIEDGVTTTGIIVMILIVGFVWGGLLCIMTTAARKERAKRAGREPGAP